MIDPEKWDLCCSAAGGKYLEEFGVMFTELEGQLKGLAGQSGMES